MVVLHGPTGAKADADWNLVLGPAPTSDSAAVTAARAAVLLRSARLDSRPTDGADGAVAGGDAARTWHALQRGDAASGFGRLLSWHAHDGNVSGGTEDGPPPLLALGFAGGAVSLLQPIAASADLSVTADFVVGTADTPGTADVGAVSALSARTLPASATRHGGGMLAADAAGCVRLWALLREGAKAGGPGTMRAALECVRALVLAPTMQLTCTSLLLVHGGDDPSPNAPITLVCGCADGRVVAATVPLSHAEQAAVDMDDVTIDVVDGSEKGVDEGGQHVYEWRFDSGAGPQGRGTVRERRRAFDGWAKTSAFEEGLQLVLAKMNSSSGTHKAGPSDSTSRGGDGGARGGGGGSSALVWKRGMHARLSGLAARPELNGAVGMLLGGVEADSGRAPVKLIAPKELEGQAIKVKPGNLVIIT